MGFMESLGSLKGLFQDSSPTLAVNLNFLRPWKEMLFPNHGSGEGLQSECSLVLCKLLLVRLCVVAWVLCNVFSIFVRP